MRLGKVGGGIDFKGSCVDLTMDVILRWCVPSCHMMMKKPILESRSDH